MHGSRHLDLRRGTGSGIAEDAPELIFERFSQASGDNRGGLGLGLYISWCLIEALGGSIRAESYTGAGSTIHLMIPA